MKGWIIFLLTLVLLTTSVTAVTVTLDGTTVTDDNVDFECSVSDLGNETLDTLSLYSTINNWSRESVTSSTPLTKTVSSVSNGNYDWNCKATVNGTDYWATSNESFTVDYNPLSDYINFTGTISNLSFNEDSSSNNAFDLDDYFESNNALTYSSSGGSNIQISISNSQISFSSTNNWSGSESITFTATDGTLTENSNEITVTVNQVNDAPYITEDIEDITWTSGNTTIDLEDSFTDIEGDTLIYSVYGEVPNHFNISIKEAQVQIQAETNWYGSGSVRFQADDGNDTGITNLITIKITLGDNNAPEISSYTPGSNPTIDIDESLEFSIIKEDDDEDSMTVTWYLDGSEAKTGSDRYTFSSNKEGSYTIMVEIYDSADTISLSWTVTVKEETITPEPVTMETVTGSFVTEESTPAAICGNSILDEGENCNNCPLDVPCGEAQICVNNECIEKTNGSSALVMLAIIISLILGFSTITYYFTTTKKVGYRTYGGEDTVDETIIEKETLIRRTFDNIKTKFRK